MTDLCVRLIALHDWTGGIGELRRAVSGLQREIGSPADGILGLRTIHETERAMSPEELARWRRWQHKRSKR